MDASGYCDAKWKRQKLCQEIKELQSGSDVLAEVLIQCLPEVKLWPRISNVGHSTKNVAPLLLCNVCSSWRTLALSIPRLWQDLFLTFTKTTPKSKEETIAMTHVWIKRSGELPLTLKLYARLSGDVWKAPCEALVNAITSYASRWEHIDFTFYPPIALPQLGNMPCLRTISVLVLEDIQIPFASCPKIARIFWRFRRTMSSAALPWHQLTHIQLSHAMPTQENLFVIQSCSKLMDFDAVLQHDDHESLSREMVVMNRSLRKLQLRVLDDCNPLLERLTLPALTDTSFNFTFRSPIPMPGFREELLRFLSRSKCKLNRLVLEDCGFDDVELLECLQHDSCASLMDLRISNFVEAPIITDAVLIPLTDMPSAENNHVLLPKLTNLSLSFCLGGSASRLGTMILSRRIPFHKQDQLRHLDVRYTELDSRDIDLLDLAESLGLEVTLEDE